DGGAACVGAPATGRARLLGGPGVLEGLLTALVGVVLGVVGVGGLEQVAGQVCRQGPVAGQVGRGRVAGEQGRVGQDQADLDVDAVDDAAAGDPGEQLVGHQLVQGARVPGGPGALGVG